MLIKGWLSLMSSTFERGYHQISKGSLGTQILVGLNWYSPCLLLDRLKPLLHHLPACLSRLVIWRGDCLLKNVLWESYGLSYRVFNYWWFKKDGVSLELALVNMWTYLYKFLGQQWKNYFPLLHLFNLHAKQWPQYFLVVYQNWIWFSVPQSSQIGQAVVLGCTSLDSEIN